MRHWGLSLHRLSLFLLLSGVITFWYPCALLYFLFLFLGLHAGEELFLLLFPEGPVVGDLPLLTNGNWLLVVEVAHQFLIETFLQMGLLDFFVDADVLAELDFLSDVLY